MARMSYVNIPCSSVRASNYGIDDKVGLKSHVRVDIRRFLFVPEKRANSDAMYAARHQVLEEYDPPLCSDHVRRPVEHIEIGKVKGGIGADAGDSVEG
jgi:hypothetical protein